MIRKNMLPVLIIFILTGCAANPPISATMPATAMPTLTPPATQTITLTAILTQPAPSPSVDTSIFPGVPDQCVRSVEEPPKDHFGNGVVLFDKPNIVGSAPPYGLYLLDMQTDVPTKLSGKYDYFGLASVTPDRSMGTVVGRIYSATSKSDIEHLLLMTADGKVTKDVPMPKVDDWFYWPIWINNRTLVINLKDTLFAWDPFTEKKQALPVDYPVNFWSIDWKAPKQSWDYPWMTAIYSPSLNRVVYLGAQGINFNLWDVEKKRNILSWVDLNNNDQPRWSPDGAHFIMIGALGDLTDATLAAPRRVYLVDNDGNASVLLDNAEGIESGAYFWSASGRYIAFLFSKKYFEDYLVIMDTQTLEITNTCVKFTRIGPQPLITWSPDDTQILLRNPEDDGQGHWKVILVDLAKKVSFPIAENKDPVGWMKAP